MLAICIRVVESESVESHVFSWSRSRFSKLLESESVFKTAGVGVGFQNCWSRSRFFKTAGVGFSKLLESESESNISTMSEQPPVMLPNPCRHHQLCRKMRSPPSILLENEATAANFVGKWGHRRHFLREKWLPTWSKLSTHIIRSIV